MILYADLVDIDERSLFRSERSQRLGDGEFLGEVVGRIVGCWNTR